MRYFILIFPLLLFLTSCHPHIHETDTMSERGPDSIYAAYLNLARSLPDSLGKIGPYIFTQRDSVTIDVIDSPVLVIGRFIDETHVFALSCYNDVGDSSDRGFVRFYRLDRDRWKKVGDYIFPSHIMHMSILHLDRDTQRMEVQVSGFGNMNGNYWNYFFKYNEHEDIVKVGGKFFSMAYKIDAAHDQIQYNYFGSWYMDNEKALLLWRGDSLVTLRQANLIISPKSMTIPRHDTLEYLINPDTTYSGEMKLVFAEKDKENSPHHKKYWDHFFDLK